MIFPHNGKDYAFEEATGDIGPVDGQPIDENNPPMVCKTRKPGKLQQMTLEITQRCNLRCEYCFHSHGGVDGIRKHGEQDMSLRTLSQAVALARSMGDENTVISFYGGEPLLRGNVIADIVEAFPGQRFRVATNGQIVPNHRLMEPGVEWQVSLDGDQIAHDRYRGDGSFYRACYVASWLLGRNADLTLMATIAPPWRLDETAAYFDTHFPDTPVVFTVADLTGSPIKPEPFPWDQLRDHYRTEVLAGRRDGLTRLHRDLIEKPLIQLHHRSRRRAKTWVPGGCCHPGVRKLFVTVDGDLRACEKGVLPVIGNVRDGVDWEAVDRMHEMFHAERVEKGCQDCWALRLCAGCWAAPVRDCDAMRAGLLETIKLYIDIHEAGMAEWLKESEVS